MRLVRRLIPRGLLGRALLIILLPLVLLQLIALYIFYGNHLDVISRRLAGALAGEVAMVAELLIRHPAEEDRRWIFREAAWRLDLSLAFESGASLGPAPPRPASFPLLPLESDLEAALRERLRRPFDTDWQSDPRSVIIRVQLPEGVLHAEAPRKRLFTATLYLFVIWVVGSSALLFAVAALFMRNQVRAFRRLAEAADAFGRGRDIGPIRPEGAAEARQAAIAFNIMRARIRRFLESRTEMLAGISHDLRTPLTRLRLGLAMLPPTARAEAEAMITDVEEMDRLITAYLAFARGEGTEQAREIDLIELVAEAVAKLRRQGVEVELSLPQKIQTALLRPDALRRLLGNLLDNARKYAQHIAVALTTEPQGESGGTWALITIDDDGPGIPPARREEAFRAFASFSGGGTGLGLAIARDIARAHGGDIALSDSPLGGLRVRVRLPL